MIRQSAADALKTASKRKIQKTTHETGDLIRNEITDKITNVSRSSLQSSSEAVTNEHEKEIPKGRYISPEEEKNIDDLIFI